MWWTYSYSTTELEKLQAQYKTDFVRAFLNEDETAATIARSSLDDVERALALRPPSLSTSH